MKVFVALFCALVCIASGSDIPEQASLGVETRAAGGIGSLPCTCSNNQCSCCFNSPVIDEKGCLNARMVDGQIQYDLDISSLPLVSKSFTLTERNRTCTTLQKPLELFSVCLNAVVSPIPHGISSCPGLQFFINKRLAGVAIFQCIDIGGGGDIRAGQFLKLLKPKTAIKVYTENYAKELKEKIATVKKQLQKLKLDLRNIPGLNY